MRPKRSGGSLKSYRSCSRSSPKAPAFGAYKERRSDDCPLITLGLALDAAFFKRVVA
ncbi:MAG: hypothetical protein L3J26_00500 [Candidatus Polarisedimenticolaceae bacterium]|nr:hypothetical protein [Candidatus Polarisedimenticolaceae bacterium]